MTPLNRPYQQGELTWYWRTLGNELIIIALAEVPDTNLVEVMETQTPSDRVEQVGILNGYRDNMGDVELEEVDVGENVVLVRVSDDDENKKRDREEVKDGGGGGGVSASIWRCHDADC